jgi:hypothetical protein
MFLEKFLNLILCFDANAKIIIIRNVKKIISINKFMEMNRLYLSNITKKNREHI